MVYFSLQWLSQEIQTTCHDLSLPQSGPVADAPEMVRPNVTGDGGCWMMDEIHELCTVTVGDLNGDFMVILMVISWWFHGDFTVMVFLRWFMVISWCFYGDLWWFHGVFTLIYGDFMVILWWFHGDFMVISRWFYGDWWCFYVDLMGFNGI